MAETTKIGWTDHTQNFWVGCNKVSTECTNCYIERFLRRKRLKAFDGPICTSENVWKQPMRWNARAKQYGLRQKVFTCSLSDYFHPGADQWRPAAWEVIRRCDQLDWLILTKRPELISDRLPADWGGGYPNVWLGVTVGVASSMDRIPVLQDVPATIRFISAEPLLERLDFSRYLDGSIHWVITGCESKQGKESPRPMDLDWVRDINAQCDAAGIAHFFKQQYVDGQLNYEGRLGNLRVQTWPSPVPAY